jgi:hypothetical protein
MVPIKYTYLIGSLLSLAVWVLIYIIRPGLRKKLLIASIVFMPIMVGDYYWLQDWWRPHTVTGTIIGLEDFILAFSNGGILAICYELFFSKISVQVKRPLKRYKSKICLAVVCVTFFIACQFIGSAKATFIAFGLGSVLVLYFRKDLWRQSAISGLIVLMATVPMYLLLEFMTTGFVTQTWFADGLIYSFFGAPIPLADLIFYFVMGAFIGPFYMLWVNQKTTK